MPDLQSGPESVAGLVAENTHAVHQLSDLLRVLPQTLYRQTFGTKKQHVIGKHVRHIIDHYTAFFGAVKGAPLDYENRLREQRLEQDNHAARDRLLAITGSLGQLTHTPANRSLRMEHVSGDQCRTTDTKVDRELVFLASHTIHHMAIIAMLAEQAGLEVPDGFGVHPSTLRHQQQLQRPMARSA
jgi:uncharacterized damage-inducible protein DinB